MTWVEAVALLAAGVAAGTINTLVGSGTLITFPTLLAFGYPPVVANISNNIGMVPGGVSGTWGYRAELEGQSRWVRLLAPMSLVGAITGALLLLVLPAEAFSAIVPVLLGISVILVLVQPRLQRTLARRREEQGRSHHEMSAGRTAATVGGTYGAGVYGGYFGAAQGVLLVGLLGSLLPSSLQQVNAIKNLLSLIVNSVAALVFLAVARDRIDWAVVGVIALGTLVGGVVGSRVGRRLPPTALRAVIAVVGVVAIVRIMAG